MSPTTTVRAHVRRTPHGTTGVRMHTRHYPGIGKPGVGWLPFPDGTGMIVARYVLAAVLFLGAAVFLVVAAVAWVLSPDRPQPKTRPRKDDTGNPANGAAHHPAPVETTPRDRLEHDD